jgi:hypothetical protein
MGTKWDAAKAKAQKALGKDAKIPEPKGFDKVQTDWFVAYTSYESARDALEDKILTLQKAGSNARLTLKQYSEKIDDEDFGLNEKDKDDAKKIKDAQDAISDWVNNILKNVQDDIDGLDELDKHLIDFKKYKPTQTKP